MGKAGRPKIQINFKELENYLRLGATIDDCVELLCVSKRTLQRQVKEKYKCDFDTLKKQQQNMSKMSLRSQMMIKAKEGDTTALIFACKTVGGMLEEHHKQNIENKKREIEIKEKELEKINKNVNINLDTELAKLSDEEIEKMLKKMK